MNVGEDGVVLGHSHVDRGVGGNLLRLLLALQGLLLESGDISAVDVLSLFRVLEGLDQLARACH